MAELKSFATGFISRLNQQQEERVRSRRESRKLIEEARQTAALKSFYSDQEAYSSAVRDRAPIEQMIQAGHGNALFAKLSEGKSKTEIENLRAIFEKGDESEIMSLIDSIYSVPNKPDINSPRYSVKGNRSNQRLLDERNDYAMHPLARILGLTGNRHQDKLKKSVISKQPEVEAPAEKAPLEFTMPPGEEEASKNPITLFFPNGQTMTARADDPKIDQALAQGATTEKPIQPLKATMLTPNEMRSVRGTLSALEDEPGPYKDFMKKYDEADTGAGDEREQIINEIYQEVSALRADRRYRDIDLGTLTTIAINRVNPRIKVESSWGGFAQDVTIESRNEYPILTPEEYQAAPSGTKFTTIDGRVGTKP